MRNLIYAICLRRLWCAAGASLERHWSVTVARLYIIFVCFTKQRHVFSDGRRETGIHFSIWSRTTPNLGFRQQNLFINNILRRLTCDSQIDLYCISIYRVLFSKVYPRHNNEKITRIILSRVSFCFTKRHLLSWKL